MKRLTFILVFFNYYILMAQPCLIGHWPLDGNANDISGNNFNGIVFGAKKEVGRHGVPNTAYRFNGLTDYINVSHDTTFDFSVNDEFSISLYVKVDSLTQNILYGGSNTILSKWEDTSNFNADYPYDIRMYNQTSLDNGIVYANRYSRVCLESSKSQGSTSMLDAVFHHILITRASDDSLRLYIDGILESVDKDVTTCATNNIIDLEFGRRGGFKNPGNFKGVIDDVKFFKCALKPEDIIYVGLNEDVEAKENSFTVYPNPANEKIMINSSYLGALKYRIYSAQGIVVKTGLLIDNQVSTQSLPAGLYHLQIESETFNKIKSFIKL